MLTTILVENERLSMIALQQTIERFCPQLEITGTASSIKEAIPLIRKLRPKLLFLDIRLDDGLSFELLQQLNELNFYVVFTTAYHEYALKAFEYTAIHYILKPISPDDLQQVVERIQKIDIKSYKLNEHLELLEDVFNNRWTRLAIPTQQEILFVNTADILYIEADANYATIHLELSKHTVTKQLGFFEEILEELDFIRTHSKYLVNPKFVKRYIRGRGGDLEMTNQQLIPVSVRRKAYVLKNLDMSN